MGDSLVIMAALLDKPVACAMISVNALVIWSFSSVIFCHTQGGNVTSSYLLRVGVGDKTSSPIPSVLAEGMVKNIGDVGHVELRYYLLNSALIPKNTGGNGKPKFRPLLKQLKRTRKVSQLLIKRELILVFWRWMRPRRMLPSIWY